MISFATYATSWVAERPNLRPKTVQLYEGLVRLHIVPVLASLGVSTVADVKEGIVRRWRKKLLDSEVGPVTVSKAYRLLKSIMATAVDDGLIRRNPCRINGAGQEHSPERPVLTVPQVFALADAFADRRYRLLILLAVFGSLRWGELAALQRDCIDVEERHLRPRQRGRTGPRPARHRPAEVGCGQARSRDPVLPAAGRTQAPGRVHCRQREGAGLHWPQGRSAPAKQLQPTVEQGRRRGRVERLPLPRPAPYRQHAWEVGATLRELMDRMGHASTRAALIYQHRSKHRDRMIADAISERVKAERKKPAGTQRARRKKKRS